MSRPIWQRPITSPCVGRTAIAGVPAARVAASCSRLRERTVGAERTVPGARSPGRRRDNAMTRIFGLLLLVLGVLVGAAGALPSGVAGRLNGVGGAGHLTPDPGRG